MKIVAQTPPVLGWLEVDLDEEDVEYLWERIEAAKDLNRSAKPILAGNITESLHLLDEDNYFFENVLKQCINEHGKAFYHSYQRNIEHILEADGLELADFWVNFQKKHEFNPSHNHSGAFSFVVWMNVPTEAHVQHNLPFLEGHSAPSASNFQFQYTDTNGRIRVFPYAMNPENNGKMLFFTSNWIHSVHPFYECDEERVSISGNIFYN